MPDTAVMDAVYRERSRMVAFLARMWPAVYAYSDPDDPDWPVVYIDAPAGQLSWHVSVNDLDLFAHVPVVDPDDARARWDGHTSDQKYTRLNRSITGWQSTISGDSPESVPCSACLARPGEQCRSVSSDQLRPMSHKLRGLAARYRIDPCDACDGLGWKPRQP